MNEKSIAKIEVKTTDLCIHCEEVLKTHKVGGDDIFSMSKGSGLFYCDNKECKFYGVMTLGRKVKTEKVEAPQGEEKK